MELFIPAVPKDAIPHVYYPNPDWTEFPFLVPVLPEGKRVARRPGNCQDDYPLGD